MAFFQIAREKKKKSNGILLRESERVVVVSQSFVARNEIDFGKNIKNHQTVPDSAVSLPWNLLARHFEI